MATFVNGTKDTTTFTSLSRQGFAEWGDLVFTWGDAIATWGSNASTYVNGTKDASTFTNGVKH